jgi:hypothetical protein
MSVHDTTGGSNSRDYFMKLADPMYKVEDKVVV